MNDFEHHLDSEVDNATPDLPPPYADVLAARDRRRTRRRTVGVSLGATALVATVLVGSSVLLGGAPAGGPDSGPVAAPSSTAPKTAPSPTGLLDVPPEWNDAEAPPVVLQLDGEQVALRPWAYCYSTGCVDGFPQPPFEDVGDRGDVPFSFPLKGWTFDAFFKPSGGGACPRTISVPVEQTGDHTFLVPPAGSPGSYDVDVFGRGPQGDVITTFAWTTRETGFLPDPSGYLGLVSDDGDGHVAYPVELSLNDLAAMPDRATATVTVTAADGTSSTVGPLEAEQGCAGDGSISFREGGSGAAEPFDLGPAPFRYRAVVSLGGETYVGTAVWPRDERADEAPYTDLTFDPPLPAFEG